MIDVFGEGHYSIVMDSYDYAAALRDLLPVVKERKLARGGTMVVRPDSGDPVWCVVEGLRALERVFGSDTNGLGYRVVRGARIIQGDGIDLATMGRILDAALAAGFSAECMLFGMGAGLLQKVNRDTMSFATKLSHIVYSDGRGQDVMKRPMSDSGKISLPGELEVKRVGGVPTVVRHVMITGPRGCVVLMSDCTHASTTLSCAVPQGRRTFWRGLASCGL